MPKSTALCNQYLGLVFNATAMPSLAQNAGSPLTALFLSLHSSSPGTGGSQSTNEINYTGYARLSVVRTTVGWVTPSGGATSNAALAQFGTCSGAGVTATHVGIGSASTGSGTMYYQGPLNGAGLAIADLIQPQFNIGGLTVTEV
jgi:hypothetical protein